MSDAKAENIKIMAEPQMDPNVCRFMVNRPVHNGVVNATAKKMAKGSPLLEALFDIEGVAKVLISGGTVTVAKDSKEEWADLARKIGTVIRNMMTEGGPLIAENFQKEEPSGEDLKEKVQKVFDEELNPGLASHGGGINLIDIQGTTVFLTMSGGCQGCAAASMTLKQGVERILKSRVPEITEVVDVTDHSAGVDPYYQ